MSRTVIFNNFKAVKPLLNRFRRSEYEIRNANLHHGDVRPFACPVEICDSGEEYVQLYSLRECECLGFTYFADPVQGFCKDQHFYLTEQGTLHQATVDELCNGEPTCRAGAPIPSPVNVNGNCSGSSCDAVGYSYVVTYVTEHAGIQVEGPPSEVTSIVAGGGTPSATVSWSQPPADYCIVGIRLYRTESTFEDGTTSPSPEGSEYLLVAEFGPSAGSFTDNVRTEDTKYPLTTYEPMNFPAPSSLVALTRTKDGIAVADDCRVYISVAGQPQFGYDGVVEIPEGNVLAMKAIGNTIFVFTDGYHVKIRYSHSQNILTIDKDVIQRNIPLRSRKSLSVYDTRVFFSSTYSLYTWDVGAYGSDIQAELPHALITPEQWKHLDPDSITGTGYEFGYMFSSDSIDYSIMLEFEGQRTDTINRTSFMPIDYINADTFGVNEDGIITYQEDGKHYTWDWRRCDCNFDIYDNTRADFCECCCPWYVTLFYDNKGKNRFSKMRVDFDQCSTDKIDAKFYLADFCEKDFIEQFEIVRSRGFSIPKYCSAQQFCVELTSCGIMTEVRLATSMQELVSSSNQLIENSDEIRR